MNPGHSDYILLLDTKPTSDLEYTLTQHLRINGMYWGMTALFLLNNPLKPDSERVLQCKVNGGFGGHPDHDPHLLSTLSALQILALTHSLDAIDSSTVDYIASLQTPSGGFTGDEYGEEDTRFVYCAVSALSILGRLDAINVDKVIQYLVACQNPDGGFGSLPGAESHAGQIFCCVGALSILNRLDLVNVDALGWWLAERQLPNGGLNGRPEKLEDVCYSWWVLASLAMIKRDHWIDRDALTAFILKCQDEQGGFADRPGLSLLRVGICLMCFTRVLGSVDSL